MRHLPGLLCVAALLAPAACRGDTPPLIDRVRVGLPAGRAGGDAGRSRNGAWAPVAVTLKAGSEGHPRDAYRLRVGTHDGEELAYQYTVDVPAMAAGSERAVQAYLVPGGEGAGFTVTLLGARGRVVQTVKATRDVTQDEVLTPADVLFFAVGAGLSQFKKAAEKLDRPEGKQPPAEDPEAGRRKFVFAESVDQLPDRWFGYDAVDVVVLATGKASFVTGLSQDGASARRTALLEWVRRGGQLVLSVGRNKQEAALLLNKTPFIDCKVTGSQVAARLPALSSGWCNREGQRPPLRQVEVATLSVGPGADVLVQDEGKPILVESSCGMGRVILVAFDLDAPPFTTWDGQEAFWTRLQAETAPYLPARGGPKRGPAANPLGAIGGQNAGYDARGELKRGLETFEEIPVVSFGVVALFVLLYIGLVGPLDYFILKKVFKRLELTWVTFPLTVLVVSAAAYAAAYALKGDELRINKIDLVDVDLRRPGVVYGNTWFTLFSPRVQSCTVGLEPAPDWALPAPAGAPGPVLTLLGGEGADRSGAQSLFPRPYEYAEDATGLRGVPVPVWATRSFSASWRAPVRADKPPVGVRDEVGPLRQSRDGQALVGKLTNNLPVELQGAALFYQDHWYALGTLAPGESRRVETLFGRDAQAQKAVGQWFDDKVLQPGLPLAPSGRPISSKYLSNPPSGYQLMKALMFYRAHPGARGQPASNAGLRTLDQSWRLRPVPQYPNPGRERYRAEAILVARTAMLVDRAETVAENGGSASRLWLGALPGGGADRPAIPGYLTQETYLRVFIPVGSR